MAVIRIAKTDNYTVMSNHHLRNKDLSLKAKGLMSLMLSLPPTWDYSIGGLVAICKESHTSIRSAIKELEENNYLIRERKNNEKGYFVYEYTLYEMPQPHTENQHTAKVETDRGQTEDRRQIKKDELSIKELNTNVSKKDKDKEIVDGLLQELGNVDLIELYWQYIDLRKEMECPLNSRSLKMLIARAKKLSKNNIRIEKLLLENAIINGWKNVFLPKESEIESVANEYKDEMRSFLGID
jgi:hypothetical protein